MTHRPGFGPVNHPHHTPRARNRAEMIRDDLDRIARAMAAITALTGAQPAPVVESRRAA